MSAERPVVRTGEVWRVDVDPSFRAVGKRQISGEEEFKEWGGMCKLIVMECIRSVFIGRCAMKRVLS